MREDVYRDPRAQARVAELVQLPKAELVDLALALGVRARPSRAALGKWRKQELAWAIAAAEFAPTDAG
ncbi:MAG TPA: hypothetical protein VFV66_17555 [Nonomuraea sp.]|nr:hypothetical protein [Nonomuraea sp.]